MKRYQDDISRQLTDVVEQFNILDVAGPQQVECWQYKNGWNRIRSLIRGNTYFHNVQTNKILPFGVVPDECKSEHYLHFKYQDQNLKFTKPPKNSVYSDDLRTIEGIQTNAYRFHGDLLTNMVHSYSVEFDPEVQMKNVLERRGIVLGKNSKQRSKNSNVLNDKFGYWAFDNYKFFSVGRPAYNGLINDLALNDKFTVMFRYKGSYLIDSEDLPLTEEEQLLNIFKKASMRNSHFNIVGDLWFYKDADNPPHKCMLPTHVGHKCTILNGYKCSMRINQLNGQNEGIFKADIASKLISQTNVNQLIYNICAEYECNFADPAFQNECRRQLEGKFFIMRYNNGSTKIKSIDFTQDENNTFERGINKIKISYKDYVKERYGMICNLKEMCVVKDRKGNAFLPQFAYLTLRSDECADYYHQILQATNQPIQERLQRVGALVGLINEVQIYAANEREKKAKRNKSQIIDDDEKDEKKEEVSYELNFGFEIDEKCIETDCLPLNYPDFIYKAEQLIEKRVNIGDRQRFRWGGYDGTKGFLDDEKPIKHWVIVDDYSSRGAGNRVYGVWEIYTDMRGFDPIYGPIQEPQVISIDMRKGVWEYINIAKESWDLIFIVLPEGQDGSEIKARFTKAVQTQRIIGGRGCLVQSMLQKNTFNKNAILGAFEDSLAKMGNILYKLIPRLPPNSAYSNVGIDKIWTIGLDVSHTTSKQCSKPSTAMMVLQTLPFQGTTRGMRCVAHLNRPRTEVIPFAAAMTMTYQALKKEFRKLQNDRTRPQVIIVFRDGIADGQLKEVYGKEVVGILRGVRMIRNELMQSSNNEIKWKPKIQFIVVSKAPIDKFGVRDRNGYVQALDFPAVVFRGITSNKLWDFFMWNYHPNKKKKINTIKPLRYVVLRDEMKLGDMEGSNAPVGLYEIINTLCYSYVFSIPFNMGGTSQPGPIVYAKHYAERFAQMILSSDENLSDLRVSDNLSATPMIITQLINDDIDEKNYYFNTTSSISTSVNENDNDDILASNLLNEYINAVDRGCCCFWWIPTPDKHSQFIVFLLMKNHQNDPILKEAEKYAKTVNQEIMFAEIREWTKKKNPKNENDFYKAKGRLFDCKNSEYARKLYSEFIANLLPKSYGRNYPTNVCRYVSKEFGSAFMKVQLLPKEHKDKPQPNKQGRNKPQGPNSNTIVKHGATSMATLSQAPKAPMHDVHS